MQTSNATDWGQHWYWIYSREGELVGSYRGWWPQSVRVKAPIYYMGKVPDGGFRKHRHELLLLDFEPLEPGNRDLVGAYLVDCAYKAVCELPSGRLCKLYGGEYEGSWVLDPFDEHLRLNWIDPEPVWSLFKHKLRKHYNE